MKNLDALLRALEDGDKKTQESAAEQLANFRPTPEQGVRLIGAAAKKYPNDSERNYEAIGARLGKPGVMVAGVLDRALAQGLAEAAKGGTQTEA